MKHGPPADEAAGNQGDHRSTGGWIVRGVTPAENAVKQGIRRARRQSRMVIIDGRAAGVEMPEAIAGLCRGVRDHGSDVDQVVALLADSTAIGWKP